MEGFPVDRTRRSISFYHIQASRIACEAFRVGDVVGVGFNDSRNGFRV